MAALKRTERRVWLLTACRDGQVLWNPAGITDGGQSAWVLYGARLMLMGTDAADLSALSLCSATHECDSQEITPDGEALLREWTQR